MGQAGISDPQPAVAGAQTGAANPRTADAARQTGDAAAQPAAASLQPEASEGAFGTTENPTGPKTSALLRLWPWKATGFSQAGRREMTAPGFMQNFRPTSEPHFYA